MGHVAAVDETTGITRWSRNGRHFLFTGQPLQALPVASTKHLHQSFTASVKYQLRSPNPAISTPLSIHLNSPLGSSFIPLKSCAER